MDAFYRENGYRHLRGVLSVDQVTEFADLAYKMITPYRDEILRQDGRYAFNDFFPSSTLVRNSVSNAHLRLPPELKPVSTSLRALLTSSGIYNALHELDGAEHYTIYQTIIFFAAQSTIPHLDSFSSDTAPHGYAHTMWIPLEDMDYLSGVPAVVPWPIGKLLTESELGLPDDPNLSFRERHDRYCLALSTRLQEEGMDIRTAFMRKGDVLVWGSLTPHFSFPSNPAPRRRLSLQVLVRPTHLTLGNFAWQPAQWEDHPVEQMNSRFDFILKDN